MKVAFYMTTILEYYGGMEKRMIDVSSELARKYPDLEITIITRDNDFTEKLNKFLAFIGWYKYNKSLLYKESFWSICKKLWNIPYLKTSSFKEARDKLKEFDVVYSKNEILEAIVFKCFIGYRNIKKLIFGCHTPPLYPWSSFTIKVRNFLYNSFVYKFFASGVSRFHVINTFQEILIKELFPKALVCKIYNPFDYQSFRLKQQKYDYQIIQDNRKKQLLWVARLTKQKWVKDLVEIIKSVNEMYAEQVEWTIIGSWEEEWVLENIKQYKNIRILWFVNQSFIPSLLSKHDLFLSTSHREGFPYNIIEAQSLWLYTLAYNIAWCNDIIHNKKNWLLFNSLQEYLSGLCSLIWGEFVPPKKKAIMSTIMKLINNDDLYNKLYFLIISEND